MIFVKSGELHWCRVYRLVLLYGEALGDALKAAICMWNEFHIPWIPISIHLLFMYDHEKFSSSTWDFCRPRNNYILKIESKILKTIEKESHLKFLFSILQHEGCKPAYNEGRDFEHLLYYVIVKFSTWSSSITSCICICNNENIWFQKKITENQWKSNKPMTSIITMWSNHRLYFRFPRPTRIFATRCIWFRVMIVTKAFFCIVCEVICPLAVTFDLVTCHLPE